MASKYDEVRYGCYSNMFLLLDKSSSLTWFFVMLTSIRCSLQFSPLAAAGSLMLAVFFLNNDFCESEHFKIIPVVPIRQWNFRNPAKYMKRQKPHVLVLQETTYSNEDAVVQVLRKFSFKLSLAQDYVV